MEEQDARFVTLRRVVDALDRVVFVDYPDSQLDTFYTYDGGAPTFAQGRLTAIRKGPDTM